ncbi:MAG: hypothetical protein Q9167_001044 [Letrouitia subvulpina]
MAEVNLDDIQGDLFNRGFPKFHEVYYFFHIMSTKEKEFSQKVKNLVSGEDKHISSLKKVLEDWKGVDGAARKNRTIDDPAKKEVVPTCNVLIAFSKSGLDKIQTGLTLAGRPSLDLRNLKLSDPIFDMGMREDGPNNLNDPPVDDWDPLFRKTTIHGLLKVAGSSPEIVNNELDHVKRILGYPYIIKDIDGNSPPTKTNSKLEGNTRPGKEHGHEHFGFRDGLSQPLLKGINSPEALKADPYMQTNQNIITVTSNPPGTQDGIEAYPKDRPPWMVNGSFLAFRKLEQDVQKWIDLVNKFADAGCKNADHCGAKLMGRWKSGAPIAKFPKEDAPPGTRFDNAFRYKGVAKFDCPLGAHIRKVHPRTDADSIKMARMIRNGIPYGTEFKPNDRPDPNDTRGLLFACYQSSLENSFQFVQRAWSNNEKFPTSKTGYDALIGQAKDDGMLNITLHSDDEGDLDPGLGQFQKSVTMKGGEYFFVPSISALKNTLGCD